MNGTLAALILWMAIRVAFTWSVENRGDRIYPAEDKSKTARQDTAIPKPKPLRHFEPIIRYNIFAGPGNASNIPLKAEQVMPAALALTLKGTAIGQGQRSYAVILDQKTRKQGLYPVNGVIQGARISHISQDRVILTLGTQERALPMSTERRITTGAYSSPTTGSRQKVTQLKGKVFGTPRPSPRHFPKPSDRNLHGIRLSGNPRSKNPHKSSH